MIRVSSALVVCLVMTLPGGHRDAAVLARQGTPSPQAPTFRGSAGFVSVDVSVHQRGRPITGLTARDFELLDNGVPQAIDAIDVALDVSSSVTGDVLDQLRRSVGQLRADLGGGDRLRLTTFNTRVTRLTEFSSPPSAIDAAFLQIRATGATAIFDAIAVALACLPSTRTLKPSSSDSATISSKTSP